jgi:hypothetical protein
MSHANEPRLTHNTALILQAIDAGFVYGFSIMDMTGLPRGRHVHNAFSGLTGSAHHSANHHSQR